MLDLMAAVQTERFPANFLDDTRGLVCFFTGGLMSGLAFAWATTRPYLRQFWYIKGDKFLIPCYSYWSAFGIMLLLGLVIPYIIARSRRWVRVSLSSPFPLLISIIIIGGAATATAFLTWKMLRNGVALEPVVIPLIFLVLASLALSIATRRVRLLPIVLIWNAIFGGAAFALIYAAIQLSPAANDWYEFVQWPIFASMFALSFGSWIIWRERLIGS
jgi:hypothetical protein